ncbi:MAG: M20/M25/M40 family metallo-hydrolase [bacterium]
MLQHSRSDPRFVFVRFFPHRLVLLGCLGILASGHFTAVAATTSVAVSVASPPASLDVNDVIIEAALADTFAYTALGELCDTIGARLAGSPEMQAAIDWAVATMQREGFDKVWTEPVTFPYWQRGREWARATAPLELELPILGLGNSIGTPPDGIEAEILAVTDFEELEARASEAAGKIVLFDPPWSGYGGSVQYRTRGASAAAKHGAVACLVRSVTNYSLNTPHTGMMRYEEDVPRIPVACVTVEDAGRLHRLALSGQNPRVHLYMEAQTLPDVESFNVIGDILGSELPDEIVLAGGHLDTWDTGTGAHDDGAGCIITLAAARLLKQLGLEPRRTIRIVLFENEEAGGFGGRAYLDAHTDEVDLHVAALESDSGAFPPRGFSIQDEEPILERLRAMTGSLAHLTSTDGDSLHAEAVFAGWSGVDIRPLVELGVPGIGHRTHSDEYFHYHHGPADTFDKIDPTALAQNVAAVAVLLHGLANDPLLLRDYRSPAPDVEPTQ